MQAVVGKKLVWGRRHLDIFKVNVGCCKIKCPIMRNFFLAQVKILEVSFICENYSTLICGTSSFHSMKYIACDFLKENPSHFKWISSVPYKKIPLYYFLFCYFVSPTYFDDWGNIVNECHCAKIPIICSNGVCASYDLIKHGYSGLVYRAGGVNALVYAIEHPLEMEIMAQNGSNFIQSEWNTKKSAKI